MKKKINEVTDYEFDPQIKERINSQYREFLKEEIKRKNREQKKDRILSIFIGTFIVVLLTLVLYFNGKLTDKYIKSCEEAGHSETYCISHS